MKRIPLLMSCLALTGCTASLIQLPKMPTRAPAPISVSPTIAPMGCPAELSMDLDTMPKVPAGAFIPKPPKGDDQAGTGWKIFLGYLSDDYAGWANEGWRRAAVTRDWAIAHCAK